MEFLHIVELDATDPDLFRDTGLDSLLQLAEEDIGNVPLRWFFCLRSLPVKTVRIWNGTQYL